MTYTLSFRIRRVYFDQIKAGTKTREVRRFTPYWHTRMLRVIQEILGGRDPEAVFVCGKDIHRRSLVFVLIYENAAQALNREPSEQGKKDIGEGMVIGFDLGKAIA